MDILLQTIILEFSIKAPKDPKNTLRLDLTTIKGVTAILHFLLQEGSGHLWPPSFLLLQRGMGPFASPDS